MKRTIKYISVVLLLSILMVACKKGFLDRQPYSNISSGSFYDSENRIEIAAIGLYGTLQTFYRTNYTEFAELPSDNAYTTAGTGDAYGQFDKFTLNATNGLLSTAWTNSYQSILQCNMVLQSLPDVSFSEEHYKKQIEGEARFVRALNYFNLVRMFGKVPLVLKVITQAEARQSLRNEIEDIYNAVISDLNIAIDYLPQSYTGANIGRATKWAAAALLGRIYITRNQFQEALVPLRNVVESNAYSLLPAFADIFNPANANNKESIFEIQYEGGTLDEGSVWGFKAHPRTLANVMGISTADATIPTVDIINTFESDSVGEKTSPRYLGTIGTMSYTNTSGASVAVKHVKKHYMEHAVQNQSDDNWPLIRYADVLLMYAEALNETEGTPPATAIELVNQVRRRAFGLSVSGADKTKDLPAEKTGTKEVFREAVLLERRLELAFEGHRWFDLVRTGRFVTVMNNHFKTYFNNSYKAEPYQQLFPVPQRELDINPLLKPNNDGY